MRSVLIGIKRFFQNKNTVTIIAIILSLGILYMAYNYRIQKATEPVDVPYAVRELEPRTLITNDMVSVKKVPGGIIGGNVLMSKNDIVGKYVSNEAVIPNGSVFYKEAIVSWDEIPSSLFEDIPDGNTVVALPVSLESTYGNSIFPGNYIDLYFSVFKDDGDLMLGKFIESIKVLAVTDSSGNNIFETNGDLATPAYLLFSVDEPRHLLLRKASYLSGTIFPVPRNAEYSKNPSPTIVASSYLEKYILDQTINVDIEDEKFGGKNKDTQIEILPNQDINDVGGDNNEVPQESN